MITKRDSILRGSYFCYKYLIVSEGNQKILLNTLYACPKITQKLGSRIKARQRSVARQMPTN